MMRALVIATLMLGVDAAQAARIDDGPLPDIGRLMRGCWVNAEGILTAEAGERVELCFIDGVVDTALIDDAGTRIAAPGAYSFRNEKLVLTSDAGWVFGRSTVICDVGVKPLVRLGLFDCVGSGGDEPVQFFDDMLFLAKQDAAT